MEWKKLRESLFSNVIYDIIKWVVLPVIAVATPLLHKYNILSFGPFSQISTTKLSFSLAGIIVVGTALYKISKGLNSRIRVYRYAKVFHVRPNTTTGDKTKNKKFLLDQCKKAKGVCIIGATGYQTFARKDAEGNAILRNVFEEIIGEINILLLNPNGTHTKSRAKALGVPFSEYMQQIINSVNFLKELITKGKNVHLKFYSQRPIWKMIILDDFLWLQYYHPTMHVEHTPVYGIKRGGSSSLFNPLYDVFQKKWFHDDNPTYDFASEKLLYPNGKSVPLINT